jgi:hypothetical protein
VNHALSLLYARTVTHTDEDEPLRLAFGLACIQRVRHLLEDPRAVAGLVALEDYVAGRVGHAALEAARVEMAQVANRHQGSQSLDGSAHAAVSATYAVAKALEGRPLDAAAYAAYATVYAYGGYAVNDPSSFESEFQWQLDQFTIMASCPQIAIP